MAKRICFVMALIVLSAAFLHAGDSRRKVALVIGNGAYAATPLKNPSNDAMDMAATLESIGFEVMLEKDADQKTMKRRIDGFGERMRGADVALFYYSGHGVQVSGENYLIPVKAEINTSEDVEYEGVQLGRLIAKMNAAGTGTNILILDACRNNPFPGAVKSGERGLAVVQNKPPESVIVYATEAGETAEEGKGRNGTFTAALLRHIGEDVGFLDLLLEVNGEVRRLTDNRQRPAKYDNLTKKIYLAQAPVEVTEGAKPTSSELAKKPILKVEKAYGSITIEVRTKGTLYLNGEPIGEITPGSNAHLEDLESGQASLEMRYLDGQSETKKVEVPKNAISAVSFLYVERPKVPGGMVFVEGGTFQMGDTFGDGETDERPVHTVTISSFYLSKYEVTYDQYDRFCSETGRKRPGDQGWGRGNRPVINVSWFDDAEYCNWLSRKEGLSPFYSISGTSVSMNWSANGYRLPTEAEWEYAAKGGKQSQGMKYAGSDSPDAVAWYSDNSERQTHPVGGKQANGLGLYDMSGNVWEWCNDWYGDFYYASRPSTDPRGPDSGSSRVLRGGSWYFFPYALRASYRSWAAPGNACNYLGFRPARPVVQER